MDVTDLVILRTLATEACAAAEKAEPRIQGAVNWADLHCTSAEFFTTDTNISGQRVWVEEACPEAYELQAFIRDYLDKLGFKDVEVMTEW